MRRLSFIALAALVILAAASLIGVARPEAARGDTTQTDLVTTIGHGVVTAVPDEATVTAGVRTDGATAAAALEANSTTMNAVVAALKQAGGDELQTQQVSLYPQTNEQGEVTGYSAQNTVSAKSDVAGAGALIDAAVGSRREHGRRPDIDAVGPGRALPPGARARRRGRAREGARARAGRRVRRRADLDRRRAGRHRAAGLRQRGGAREGDVDPGRAREARSRTMSR